MLSALLFLAEAAIAFFCVLFLLRFAMQLLRVSFVGPLGQFVASLTRWAVLPLRRIVPGWFGLDLASLLAAFLLQMAFTGLVYALTAGPVAPAPLDLLLLLLKSAGIGLLRLSIHLLIGVLIVQAVLSWVNPHSPLAVPANQLSRPFLAPIRRFLPLLGGIDLSPLIVILLAQAVLMLL